MVDTSKHLRRSIAQAQLLNRPPAIFSCMLVVFFGWLASTATVPLPADQDLALNAPVSLLSLSLWLSLGFAASWHRFGIIINWHSPFNTWHLGILHGFWTWTSSMFPVSYSLFLHLFLFIFAVVACLLSNPHRISMIPTNQPINPVTRTALAYPITITHYPLFLLFSFTLFVLSWFFSCVFIQATTNGRDPINTRDQHTLYVFPPNSIWRPEAYGRGRTHGRGDARRHCYRTGIRTEQPEFSNRFFHEHEQSVHYQHPSSHLTSHRPCHPLHACIHDPSR